MGPWGAAVARTAETSTPRGPWGRVSRGVRARSGSVPEGRGGPAWLAWWNGTASGGGSPCLSGDPGSAKLRCSDPPAALKGP